MKTTVWKKISLLQTAILGCLRFTLLEWLTIVISGVSICLDIYTALLLDAGRYAVAFPLLVLGVFLTALSQGVWIKCLRNMHDI